MLDRVGALPRGCPGEQSTLGVEGELRARVLEEELDGEPVGSGVLDDWSWSIEKYAGKLALFLLRLGFVPVVVRFLTDSASGARSSSSLETSEKIYSSDEVEGWWRWDWD